MLLNDSWNEHTPAEAVQEDASPWKQFRVTLMPGLWFDCLAAWKLAVVLRSLHGARRQRYSAHSGFLKPQRTSHMWTRCLCVRGPILQTCDRDQRQASSAVRLVGTCCEILFVRLQISTRRTILQVTADDHELNCRFVMLCGKPSSTTLKTWCLQVSLTRASTLQKIVASPSEKATHSAAIRTGGP